MVVITSEPWDHEEETPGKKPATEEPEDPDAPGLYALNDLASDYYQVGVAPPQSYKHVFILLVRIIRAKDELNTSLEIGS